MNIMDPGEHAYSLIDPVLQQWSKKHSWQLVKVWKDEPVRGFNIVSQRSDIVEIHIAAPKDGMVNIALGGRPNIPGTTPPSHYLGKSTIPISQLTTALDKALEQANSWFATLLN